MTNQAKAHFASLPTYLALDAIKGGWELETQNVDGYTYEQIISNRPKVKIPVGYQAACDAWAEAAYRKMTYADILVHKTFNPSVKAIDDEIASYGIRSRLSPHTTLDEMIRLSDNGSYLKASITNFKGNLKLIASMAVDRGDPAAWTPWNFKVPDGVVYAPDGTVSGPEFKIEGYGCKAGPFISRLKKLLANHTMQVDEGCSFHIHISVPGIEHKYGKLLQVRMMEYLMRNLERVPEDVKKRWRKSTEYFKPHVSTDKYSFVHFHNRYKTWEFRCFGNINNVSDAAQCLRLAVGALQYAYKCQLGTAKSHYAVWTDWKPQHFQTMLKEGHDAHHKEATKAAKAAEKRERELENEAG